MNNVTSLQKDTRVMASTPTPMTQLKKGELMKTLKKAAQAALATGLIVLGLGMFKEAQAANPDTMTITVTPGGVTYSVTISSPFLSGYNFGTVNVGVTTVSTVAIAVQNSGNISEYFSLGVVDTTGGGLAWTNAAAPNITTYTMQGLFQADQPESANFAGAGNNIPTAAPGTAANRFGQGTTRTLPAASANLWLQLQMPTGVADTGAHTMVLSINGQSS
jgi:hypothetical protein